MMQYSLKFFLAALVLMVLTLGCSPSPSQLKKVISENPDILTDAIEKNPAEFVDALRKAHRKAQGEMRARAEQEEKKRQEEEYKNPKKPEIGANRAILGPKNAPITIVEYSDFECPFCSKGYKTSKEVLKKYGSKVRLVFKHLPLSFHKMAMPAALRFEAIALQSPQKAYKYHDLVFENQNKLKGGDEKVLDSLAKEAGANVAKMKKDMASSKVKDVIKKDMEEARKFGITGTPGFIVEGITLKGAYPVDSFSKIIDRRLKEKGQ